MALRRLAPAIVIALLVSAGAALPTQSLSRSTTDRPDERSGPQVHVVYAVPSDGQDRQMDIAGALSDSVAVWEQWFVKETGGSVLRLDTFGGVADVTFLRLPQTTNTIKNASPSDFNMIRNDLVAAGLNSSQKLYAVYYEGPSARVPVVCGLGGDGMGFAYLLQPQCPVSFARPGQSPAYPEFNMVHELLHGLGFVPSCAPHSNAAHVTDSSADVMYAPSGSRLDVGRDDYYEAHIPGCLDLANSAYLGLVPPVPPGSVAALAGDGQATIDFTPASTTPTTTAYTVTSSPGGHTGTGIASPITVTGLTNGTPYTFSLVAKNGTESAAPVLSNQVTPLGRPGPPTSVVATPGDGQATVSFDSPAVTGGAPALWYTVTASPGGQSASGTASPVTVYGLANGTSYEFDVTAVNPAGAGTASLSSDPITPEGEPRAHEEPPPGSNERPPVPDVGVAAASRPPRPAH